MSAAAFVLSFAFSFLASLIFALVIHTLFRIKRIPTILSVGFLSVLIFGADIFLGVTDGLVFLFNTGLMNFSLGGNTLFAWGVFVLLAGIVCMVIAAGYSVISDAVEG